MARVRATVDGDVFELDVVAWDRIGAERLVRDRGGKVTDDLILYIAAIGYHALCRSMHGAKRTEWPDFDELTLHADFEDLDDGDVGPTVAGRPSGEP